MATITLTIEIADEDIITLEGADLTTIVRTAIRREATSKRAADLYHEAAVAGALYEARYMSHQTEYREKFLTKEEAANFLEYGEDDGTLSSIGVFDGAGNDLDWSYVHGWKHAH